MQRYVYVGVYCSISVATRSHPDTTNLCVDEIYIIPKRHWDPIINTGSWLFYYCLPTMWGPQTWYLWVNITHLTSCHGRCRVPGCSVVFFCYSFEMVGWGGVGCDVNVHVTLMMLRWSWGGVGWDANVHVTLMMLRWSWGGVGWDVNVHVTLMMLRWSWGGVGWDANVHVTLMMLRWSWGGVGWDVNVHVMLMMLRWSQGWGGVGCWRSCYAHDVTLIMGSGGVGWDVNVHVTLMMLRWSWGGVARARHSLHFPCTYACCACVNAMDHWFFDFFVYVFLGQKRKSCRFWNNSPTGR